MVRARFRSQRTGATLWTEAGPEQPPAAGAVGLERGAAEQAGGDDGERAQTNGSAAACAQAAPPVEPLERSTHRRSSGAIANLPRFAAPPHCTRRPPSHVRQNMPRDMAGALTAITKLDTIIDDYAYLLARIQVRARAQHDPAPSPPRPLSRAHRF